jgi:glyoxylase-like metal-dependent hydrolase (beta-lactamase superfamily II)
MNIKKCLTGLAAIPGLILTGYTADCSAGPGKEARTRRTMKNNQAQIYTFESDGSGFNTKNFFYDNGEEIVVFDSQFTPDAAKKSIEFLRTKTQNPISYVVITHPNPDKFNGMNVFQEQGAKVIASRSTADNIKGVHEYKKYYFVNMAKMFTEETYPKLSTADILFTQSYEIKLKNGEVIKLSELAQPGVSTNQTVASIPSLNALVVGDLVHNSAHAWLEGGIVNGKPTPTIKGWIADLKELSTNFGAKNPMTYGGRGQSVSLDRAVRDQINYLEKADSIVTKYVAALGPRKIELQNEKAGSHMTALQAEFEKEFPGYSLGFMIQYGVYGLANSKL